MRLALNCHNMMQEAIGENGFTKDELCALPIEAAIWGMKATYALLGKPGFAQKKAGLNAAPKKKEEYIVR